MPLAPDGTGRSGPHGQRAEEQGDGRVDVEVRVSGGAVRGVLTDGVAAFRGMPYALAARFGAPGRAQPWDGVRDATAFGPPPPQPGAGTGARGADDGSDWLTANVWSPELAGGLPVMVWVQGGGYLFGTSGLPEYDGTRLAREGVVVVTFNHRVGLEGFGHVEGCPANRGLLDQVAALEWVRENAAAFGGDSDRVTLFGQSAGAGSVAALLVVPRAAGLFRRAVAQSVPGAFLTPALAADVARVCAAHLGVAPGELPTVDAHALPAAAAAVLAGLEQHVPRWGAPAHAGVLLAPVIDGDVLPCTPWEGLTGDVDLLVGHTRDEERLLSLLTGRLGAVTDEQALRTAELLAPDPLACLEAFPDAGRLDEVVRSDWLFRMPSLHLADAQRAAGGRAHLYELTWPAPGMGGALGACHGLDVPLVFGTLTAGQPAALVGDALEEAEAVSAQMRHAWTAFARDGDPGWDPYDGSRTRLFDAQPSVVPYPESTSRRLWQQPPVVCDLR